MQKTFRRTSPYLCGILLLALIVINGCKKTNSVDNNQIIETPYSLFFSDTAGAVYQSNDGKTYTTIFQADGYPCRAICTSLDNVIIIKKNLYTGINGANFSVQDTNVTMFTTTDCNGNTVGLNESMLLNIPDWQRVYVTCNAPPPNFLGEIRSSLGGLSFNNYDFYGGDDTLPGGIGSIPVQFYSYSRLKCGTVCALAMQPVPSGGSYYPTVPPFTYRNFYRNDTEIFTKPWEEVTGDANGASKNQTGTPLPSNGFFTLGHYNNRLIAIDGICNNGAYYSDDTGRNWYQYPGIASGVSALSISSPFDQVCLIGTSAGLYVLNVNLGGFILNVNGLTNAIRVNGISYKENTFVSGNKQQFIYLATNKGIYQSTDLGANWVMTIPGNYTTIY